MHNDLLKRIEELELKVSKLTKQLEDLPKKQDILPIITEDLSREINQP